MKAAVFHGPRDVRLQDVPEPEVRDGSVKVKVDWCGICGTDLHEYLAGPIFIPPVGSPHPLTGETLPLTLGHEFAGEVVDVGGGVDGIATGDRVAIEPVYRCGTCAACRRGVPNLCSQLGFYGLMGGGGGMSEYAVMPSYMVHHLPDGLTYEQGALVEPIAVGLRAVRRAGIGPGESALVLGGGPIGAVTVQCLRAIGAGTIMVAEVADARKRKALEITRLSSLGLMTPIRNPASIVCLRSSSPPASPTRERQRLMLEGSMGGSYSKNSIPERYCQYGFSTHPRRTASSERS